MITNKQEYKEYLLADAKANKFDKGILPLFKIQRSYLRRLRKTEYLINCKPKSPRALLSRFLLNNLGVKCGWTIPPNTFGKGLYVPHYGTIIVNHTSRFGDNCVLQCGVNISEGASGGNKLYFAAGSKVMKNVHIADGVIVGANAVVTKNIMEKNVVVAGVPAKIISNNGFENRATPI